jgi:hypothetical protein
MTHNMAEDSKPTLVTRECNKYHKTASFLKDITVGIFV